MDRNWTRKSPKVSVTADQLISMYHEKEMSYADMAVALGCGRSQVCRLMQKHGVSARPFRDAGDPIRRAKISAWRATQFSPMANPFRRGCPSIRVGDKKVRLYRLVAEAVIGRPLRPDEAVHHCNNCQADNRPANLWVFPSRSDHTRYHRTGIIHPDTIKLTPYSGELSPCQLAT
jgi:hypothetical protein